MDYGTMVQAILTLHRDSVGRAAGAVNQALLFRNWLIGAYVVEYEQCGEDRAAYGAGLLADLARDLRRRGVGGCSAEMVGRMRSFYRSLLQLRTRIPPSRRSRPKSSPAWRTRSPTGVLFTAMRA